MHRRRLGSRRGAAVVLLAAGALALAAVGARASGARGPSQAAAALHAPARLADTGLYADFASRRVDARNLHFSPQYPLWTDGARKERWIYLPPGTAIDARDPDAWVFPAGTKLWKEFSWGRRVETRYLERTRRGWLYATYLWSEDESDAVLAPAAGVRSSHEVLPGRVHALPSVSDCITCHRGGRSEVLGFSALQLSPDRDPLAPNAEAQQAGDVTLDVLVKRGLVRGLPRELREHPPRIEASTPRGRAAMGYLHANCSTCHDSVGPLRSLGVSLRHSLQARAPDDEPAFAAVGHPTTRYRIPGAPQGSVWIDPGAPSSSALVHRMSSRSPITQMPPLGTAMVDEAAVALVREWIEQDVRPTHAAEAVNR